MIRLVESRRRGEVCSGGLGRGPSVRGVVCAAAYRVGGGCTSPHMRSRCRCVVGTVLGLSAAAGAAAAPPRHAQSLSYSVPHVRAVLISVLFASPLPPNISYVYSRTARSAVPLRRAIHTFLVPFALPPPPPQLSPTVSHRRTPSVRRTVSSRGAAAPSARSRRIPPPAALASCWSSGCSQIALSPYTMNAKPSHKKMRCP